MHVFVVILETEDEFFALEQHLIHLSYTLNRLHFFNELADLFLDSWFQTDCILGHLEWNACTLRKLDILIKLVPQIFQIIGLGTRML